MPRHTSYIPNGVIPAVLLPFFDDLSSRGTQFVLNSVSDVFTATAKRRTA